MSTVLLVTLDLGGNIPPAIGIAAELARRGHRVVVHADEAVRARTGAAGCDFVPADGMSYDPLVARGTLRTLREITRLFADRSRGRSAVEAARPEVVVNELTDLAQPLNPRKYDEWLAGTNRLRREGTKNLVEAAASVGATKFISQSVAFAYRFDPGVKTEDSAIIGAAAGDMGAAMEELERLAPDPEACRASVEPYSEQRFLAHIDGVLEAERARAQGSAL